MTINNADFQSYYESAWINAEHLRRNFVEWLDQLVSGGYGFTDYNKLTGLELKKSGSEALEFSYLGNSYLMRLKIRLVDNFTPVGKIEVIEKDEYIDKGFRVVGSYDLTHEGYIPEGNFEGVGAINIGSSVKGPFYRMLSNALRAG